MLFILKIKYIIVSIATTHCKIRLTSANDKL